MNFLSTIYTGFKNLITGITARIFFVILIVSITANVFQFYANGITIDRSDRSDRKIISHQEQYQGQLFIQNNFAQGDMLEWKRSEFMSEEEAFKFTQQLPPYSSLFAKIVEKTLFKRNTTFGITTSQITYKFIVVIYPEFKQKGK